MNIVFIVISVVLDVAVNLLFSYGHFYFLKLRYGHEFSKFVFYSLGPYMILSSLLMIFLSVIISPFLLFRNWMWAKSSIISIALILHAFYVCNIELNFSSQDRFVKDCVLSVSIFLCVSLSLQYLSSWTIRKFITREIFKRTKEHQFDRNEGDTM